MRLISVCVVSEVTSPYGGKGNYASLAPKFQLNLPIFSVAKSLREVRDRLRAARQGSRAAATGSEFRKVANKTSVD
jgi:hypothetical protein